MVVVMMMMVEVEVVSKRLERLEEAEDRDIHVEALMHTSRE